MQYAKVFRNARVFMLVSEHICMGQVLHFYHAATVN